ncbi:MAG: sodium:proton antiporter [Flavobacteriaceae bacterium]
MLELAGLIILGIIAQWVAWRLKLPAILPLILIGLLVGPLATLYTDDASKIIEPVWNGTKGLFPGDGLYYFVSLAIAVILFEGGLTLKRSEIRNVGPVITKLITVGTLVTFLLGGAAAHYIFELSWKISFLFSALIIVTGPTVITPILRNIPLKKDVSAVLKWEGILIDPIGALVAVLVFEFISVGEGQAYTETALIEFGKIILFGCTFGFTFAHALAFVIKRNLVPHYLLNVVSLSVVLLVFVESDLFAHESGLLAVVVMGMVLGNMNLPNLKELLYFKESLSVLLISILFILLAAHIDIKDMELIYNWKTAILFVIIVFLIRPLAVFLSTRGSSLKFNEKLFIGWVGPRGIVAAGIASLFGSKLVDKGETGAEYITPLVFMVVLGTVLLNATTARYVAKWVGVFLKHSEGILIIGASKFSRLIGAYLKDNDKHVVLIDNNPSNVEKAKKIGIEALEGNIYSDSLTDDIELNDMGYLLALTGNADINRMATKKFGSQFGEHGTFRVLCQDESKNGNGQNTDKLLSATVDFSRLTEIALNYPSVREIELEDNAHFRKLLKLAEADQNRASLFLKSADGKLDLISVLDMEEVNITENQKLVYLGKSFDPDELAGNNSDNTN